jgi:rhodanese-related sulfurtransferase
VDAPDIHHVPWALGVQLQLNCEVISSHVKEAPEKTLPVLFLCRSGKRSSAVVDAALAVGYKQVFSIREGCEGNLKVAL